MRYVMQLKDGYMLQQDVVGDLSVKHTGYPYPETPKSNVEMLISLFQESREDYKDIDKLFGDTWDDMTFWSDSLLIVRNYAMRCFETGRSIHIKNLISVIKTTHENVDLPLDIDDGVYELLTFHNDSGHLNGVYFLIDKHDYYCLRHSGLFLNEDVNSSGVLHIPQSVLMRRDFAYRHNSGNFYADIEEINTLKKSHKIYSILCEQLKVDFNELESVFKILRRGLDKDNIDFLEIAFTKAGLASLRTRYIKYEKDLIFGV